MKGVFSFLLIPALSIGTAACQKNADEQSSETLLLAYVATQTAVYRATFEATWSAATHSGGVLGIPADPHFSQPIAGAHSAAVEFWAPGKIASDGIVLMAERGRTAPFAEELAAGGASSISITPGIDSPGSLSFLVTVSPAQPLVTFVSMVAPSPDWFVGVHGLSMMENGVFVASRQVSLLTYDAGSDSGTTFTAANLVTDPKQNIGLLNVTPLQGNPLGTLTLVRQ